MDQSTEKVELTRKQLEEYIAFYKDQYLSLTWYLVREGASAPEAADVAQHAMAVVLERWSAVSKPVGFVRTVALRALRRGWDQAKREAKAHARITPVVSVTEFDANLEVDNALAMLNRLSPAQRDVFALAVDGFERAEIAEILGMEPATVGSNLRHARKKINEMIKECNSDLTRKEASDGYT